MAFCVEVTQFIDPNLFFFKCISPFGEKTPEWERDLQMAIQNEIPGYNGKTNEMVAIFVPEWQKWVRGEVDLVLREFDGPKYIVWCTDYG